MSVVVGAYSSVAQIVYVLFFMNQDPGEYGGCPTSYGEAEIGGGGTLISLK